MFFFFFYLLHLPYLFLFCLLCTSSSSTSFSFLYAFYCFLLTSSTSPSPSTTTTSSQPPSYPHSNKITSIKHPLGTPTHKSHPPRYRTLYTHRVHLPPAYNQQTFSTPILRLLPLCYFHSLSFVLLPFLGLRLLFLLLCVCFLHFLFHFSLFVLSLHLLSQFPTPCLPECLLSPVF